jgi:hypothetical protein
MSKSERLSDKIRETKLRVFERDGWRCVVTIKGARCPAPARQAAHILPNDDVHLARYGDEIINHPANMRATCGLRHNAMVQINYRNRPADADEQAERVRQIIAREAGEE